MTMQTYVVPTTIQNGTHIASQHTGLIVGVERVVIEQGNQAIAITTPEEAQRLAVRLLMWAERQQQS